ncbi:hypothetical protein T484DRAFT_1834693 [Baffinella frigidus]|nr:hypothetical protein T484DRAFT_1834693 [Cryptophyta sp. CCMP2293]
MGVPNGRDGVQVPVPEGLDLDAWIHEPSPDGEDDEDEDEDSDGEKTRGGDAGEADEDDSPKDKKKKTTKKKKDKDGWEDEDFGGKNQFSLKPSKKEIAKMQKQAEKDRKKRTCGPQ